MSNIPALRLLQKHEIDLSEKMPDLSKGFTIEAWVCPAPMDRAVRLYPEPGYGGKPVRLKEGLHRNMAEDYLPQLGSACLPEAMEAVIFSRPDFQGESLTVRQDLPQAPDSPRKIGSVVVLDRSHRRQNHVVLFDLADYKGKTKVLILPDFWQRLHENNTKEETTDQKPVLAQVGSAWVPPGVALEVTQLDQGENKGSSSTIPSFLAPDLAGILPPDWPIKLQQSIAVDMPENSILFLFEKPEYAGKSTVVSRKQRDWSSLPWPVRSAIYVGAPDNLEGVIGIGPKPANSAEREVRLFPIGTPMPVDSVHWQFWVPPNFRLVPTESQEIPESIEGGLHECQGSTSYVIKRVTEPQTAKDTTRIAEGIRRVQLQPDQPKIREGQAIYRSADGKWEKLSRTGQTWLQDAPDFGIVNIPKRYALFLFRMPIAEVKKVDDYELLTDGIFDLRDLAWTPKAAIFCEATHGTDGVLSLSRHVQVIPADRALHINSNHEVWAPPGFELIRQKLEWGSGFHRKIAVFGHCVAQVVRSTLRGDLPTFNPAATYIRPRRDASPADSELADAGSEAAKTRIGIVATKGGTTGLTMVRQHSDLRGAGDELRFGGQLLRPDRWVHLALTWDGTTMYQFLDGRPVQPGESSEKDVNGAEWWVLGESFRGAIAQVRVWESARTVEQIRDERYPSTTQAVAPALDLFAQGFDAWQSPPDAVVVSVDLPAAPVESVLVRHMQQQVEAENAQQIQLAHQHATAQKILAHKQAQRTVAIATEQARRDVHLQGMTWFAFVRGDEVICRAPKTEAESETGQDGNRWSALGDGIDQKVWALAFDEAGNLYAGGEFTQAGGVAASKLAKWDGSSWSALGDGVTLGFVDALAFDAVGNLYAGGGFTQAGGVAAYYIAKWDGSSWSALGGGVDGAVNVLACDVAGNLYAGGYFPKAGGAAASNIAKWDGSSWSALGGGVDGAVNVLACDVAGNLYAGGGFTQAGEVAANYIAKWDSSSWSALGDGVDGVVFALAFDEAGNLYAGGEFTQAGGAAANYIAKWDGSSWSALGDGVDKQVYKLAIDVVGNLYAGGGFTQAGEVAANYIAKWDGSSWSALGDGVNLRVNALAFDVAGNLYAGGDFTQAGGVAASYIAKWVRTPHDIGNLRITDLAMDAEGRRFVSLDGTSWQIRNLASNRAVSADLPNPPRALTCDFSGKHAKAKREGEVWIGLYWIEADGAICRAWIPPGESKHDERQQLFGSRVPLGRPDYWDIAIDTEKQILFWTNGWELYWSSVVDDEPMTFRVLLPHVASPFPIALAVAPDHSLLWLDAEDEVVRMLPNDDLWMRQKPAKTLYPAPRPANGLVVSRLADDRKSEQEAAFVYWVAAERRTLEAPILDTPGRYIDLYYDPKHPGWHGQHVDMVAVNEFSGVRWTEASWVMNLDQVLAPGDDAEYGPFPLEDGIAVEAKLFLRGDVQRDWGSGSEHAVFNILFNDASIYKSTYLNICDTGARWGGEFINTGKMPFDQWFDLRFEISRLNNSANYYLLQLFVDSKLAGENQSWYLNLDAREITIYLPAIDNLNRPSGVGPARGLVGEVKVTSLKNRQQVLARRTPFTIEGSVVVGAKPLQHKLLLEHSEHGSPTRVLSFGTLQNSDPSTASQIAQPSGPDNFVSFEPVHLDLHRGLTIAAQLIWDGLGESNSEAPICLYELSTFEDQDRITCGIESDGLPILSLRFNGRQYPPARRPFSDEHDIKTDKRLAKGQSQVVVWTLTPHGLVSAYIDGELVLEQQLLLPDEPDPGYISPELHTIIAGTNDKPVLIVDGKEIKRPGKIQRLPAEAIVFENHRLGAANTPQTHAEVKGALHTGADDVQTIFAGFQGRIIRCSAWNCTVPRAANGWEHTPSPDPTWARSLVTVESKRRYLHAGRLDGLEPPVTLFPIELDGGLSIETVLDQAHAELTLAHAQKAAAEDHAAHLKTAALQDAHAKLEAATQNLVDTQAKAAADIAAAQAQADHEKADARTKKASADATAERDRVQGKQDADQTKADGLKQAQDLETSAADDKRNRIADANRRRSDKQRQLDDANKRN